jgi:hypothetical protein
MLGILRSLGSRHFLLELGAAEAALSLGWRWTNSGMAASVEF